MFGIIPMTGHALSYGGLSALFVLNNCAYLLARLTGESLTFLSSKLTLLSSKLTFLSR